MAEDRTFTLIGKFDDQITKKLENINKLLEGITKTLKSIEPETKRVSKSFDSLSESVSGVARAASRAAENVGDIGNAAGRANGQAEDLLKTLLKAEGLSKVGDAMAKGFERGMRGMAKTASAGAGVITKLFRESMEDEMADIKAASGIQGSFGLAGYKGSFSESEKMYKKYDQVVSEMIRQSSAPTAKVVELQRYTLDTMGPLMLAAQGVKKGTAMKDIDPKKIEASAIQYGQFLEKAALFSQGTGSAGFRVAAGIEGLVTRGKIDTQLDFFTDNIMLMKNLEHAGFMGRQGGGGSGKMMTATDAVRMKAMMDAFNKSMSSESTAAMAQSLTGSLQGLQDTVFNPSVGILGMSVTFTKEEQKRTNAAIVKIQNGRINHYKRELAKETISIERAKQLRNNIEQAEKTRDVLTKDGADKISTPFKAFSYAFTGVVRALTNALNAVGPVWTHLSLAAIEVTNRVFGPLAETLENVASNMRYKPGQQMRGFGRIMGEIYKAVGKMMGDLANMLTDPKSAMGKAQSEFMKGFMEAFKEPGELEKAKENLRRGIWALFKKLGDILLTVIGSEEARPFVLTALALAFGPPLISAIIAGATPLILTFVGRVLTGLLIKYTAATDAAFLARMTTVARLAPAGGVGAAAAGGVGSTAAAAGGGAALLAMLPAILLAAGGVVVTALTIKAIADSLNGTAAKEKEAADKQMAAAETQKMAAALAKGGVNAKQVLSFGSSAQLGARLKLLGMDKDMRGANLLGAYESRNVLLDKQKKQAEALQNQTNILERFGIKGAAADKQLAPFKNSLEMTNKSLKKAQTDLETAFVGLGPMLQNALLQSLSMARISGLPGGGLPGIDVPNLKEVYPPKNKGMNIFGVDKRYNGGIGDAISSEMRNKPSGSNLVIANSSETIIPAAGGLGMKELFRTLDERSMGTINAPITIHQQPGQNAEQLAALVAMELGNAIRHARASSVYV